MDFLPFHYQLGLMGFFLLGTAFFYEYVRGHWITHDKWISKPLETTRELVSTSPNSRQRHALRYVKGFFIGLALSVAFLLGIYTLTYIFGFLFVFPISFLYLIGSFLVSFSFSLGIEWMFRHRIQTLINETQSNYKNQTTKVLNFFLIFVLPFVMSIGFFLFAGAITPAVFFLFYAVTGLCAMINWYLFDHMHSLVPTVTFSTLVMGWVLAGCLTPAFF
ncbi:MAG: hypothetical protein RBG13Loki_1208 [Promethearchaeota archaeon CR_4]|nr:MAG: hypothetical protein RBG13Loki_1208 [Candidatus Lokiarchaeota archaeon CR_4]